jgi:MFS family permease
LKTRFRKDWQYYKFCLYGFLKNQRFFEPFLLLIFLREKGLNYTQIGTLYALRFILRMIFEVPSGVMADAMGRRGTMLFAYAFYMISFGGYYYATSFLWLIVPTVLFSMGDAFRTGTHKAMIFEYLKRNGWQDQKVAYYGHTRSWSQTGSAISSLLASILVLFSKTYTIVFLYCLIPYTLGFILLASYPGYLESTTTSRSKKATTLIQIRNVIIDSVRAIKNLSNLKLIFNIASFSGLYDAAKDYLQIIISMAVVSLPVYIHSHRAKNEKEIITIGLIYFILYFLTAAASRNSGRMANIFKSGAKYLNFFMLAGIFTAIGAGVFYQVDLFIPAIALFLFILIIENLRRPAGVSAVADQFSEDILASILSVESQVSSVLAAILSFLIGFLADLLGPGYGLVAAALVLLIVFPFLKLKPIVKNRRK